MHILYNSKIKLKHSVKLISFVQYRINHTNFMTYHLVGTTWQSPIKNSMSKGSPDKVPCLLSPTTFVFFHLKYFPNKNKKSFNYFLQK